MMSACWKHKRDPMDHADIGVVAVHGERRVVAYRVKNDASDPVDVTPVLTLVTDLSTGAPLPIAPWTVAPGTSTPVAPGASLDVTVAIETEDLLADHVYGAELMLTGTKIAPVRLVVAVERAEPLEGRHDPSPLRAWIKDHCFGHRPTTLRAPGQELGCCQHEHGHGHKCCGHRAHGHWQGHWHGHWQGHWHGHHHAHRCC